MRVVLVDIDKETFKRVYFFDCNVAKDHLWGILESSINYCGRSIRFAFHTLESPVSP